jgi:hypothetical protein
MAQQDYSGIITIGILGVLGYYAYEQGWFSNLFGASTVATSTGTPAAAINCPSPGVLTAGVCVQPLTTSTPANQASSTPAVITTPPAPTTAPNSNQAGPILQLAAAALAGSGISSIGGTMDADQWNYFWNQLGFTPNNNFDATFFPNGRPASQSNYTQYTAAQFVVAADAGGTGGVSGLGFYSGVPYGAIHGGW